MAMTYFHSTLHQFLAEEEISPIELGEEDAEWLMYITNYFFLRGMGFAANVGGVEIERRTGQVH